MAVSIEDIKKLRAMTGAGLADVKKALTEAEGDFDKAKELLRERGLAIAAKRSDRETSNGCVLVKKVNDFAAIIALKCETDFVANGADFIKLTSDILDAAIAAKAHTLDEVKTLKVGDADAQAAVTQRSGITGEKMELDGYCVLEGDNIEVYDHMNKHTLCTMVQLNENNEEAGHKVAMQVAAMRPVALDESSVSEETKKSELEVAVAKTKEELVEKAVNAALKKAGINPAHVDSEDHIIERMEGLQFKVGPKSFYQTNSAQAYELYKVARDFAALTGKEILYDLYTGTGTIANFCAARCAKVVGVEYVPEAIEDARINSTLNGIGNTVFYAGDMKAVLSDEFIRRNGRPDVIILDPPRAGVDEPVIDVILRAAPERIVYVSCNPATQARDLALMDGAYRVEAVQPVDMFPHTHHVENVVKLVRR
jgi:translation elongation factor Ts